MKSTLLMNKPISMFFIGDSHTIIYNNLLLRNDWLDNSIITRSSYLGGIQAENFIDINGQIRNDVIQSLFHFGLITKTGKILHLSNSLETNSILRASDTSHRVPIIIFSVGEIDIRNKILRQFGDVFDFLMPQSFALSDLYNCIKVSNDYISTGIIRELIKNTFAPLVKGLSILKKSGFTRTYLHCLPPPTQDNEKFFEMNNYYFNRALHTKIVYFCNETLKSMCSDCGITFIDTWKKTTNDNGFLNDEYNLDHNHLNKKSVIHTIQSVVDDIHDSPDPKALTLPYKKITESAQKHSKLMLAADNTTFQTNRYTTLDEAFDGKAVDILLRKLKFDLPVINQYPLYDWIGSRGDVSGDKHNFASTFTSEILELIYEQVYNTNFCKFVENCMKCHFITLVRAVNSKPHEDKAFGSQAFHRDGNPNGILRGILYLCDVDKHNGPFEVLNKENNIVTKFTGKKGHLIVFDAQNNIHRGSPPRKSERVALDFVFLPSLSVKNNIVIHQSINSWPVDPYNFRIDKFLTWPKVSEKYISLANQRIFDSMHQAPSNSLHDQQEP